MAKTLEPVLMKNWDSDEVHSGFVDEAGEAISWCGTLREHGESEVIVFTGPLSDVTCERCRRDS
jgi:hypothetical protein